MGRRRPIWPAESRGAAFRGLKWTYTSHLTLGTRGLVVVGGGGWGEDGGAFRGDEGDL
jgi:hypothetical protein